MSIVRAAAACLVLAVPAASIALAVEFAPIKQEMQTAHYRLALQIGPMEEMFMPVDVATKHLTTGEVMLGGDMSLPTDLSTARHLEVHVLTLDKNAPVTDADVAISVTDASKIVQQVPVTTMYGLAEGPSDTHYGNNVSLPPGAYTVEVTANGEKASFTVAIPPS